MVTGHGLLIFGGWYKGENMPNYLDRFKMASCPLKGDGFLIPNRIKTYLCGTKNGKVICYRIIDCREMGVWVLKVTIQWTVRAWRPKHREYEVSLSLLQIGSNSYQEVALRNLWLGWGVTGRVVKLQRHRRLMSVTWRDGRGRISTLVKGI